MVILGILFFIAGLNLGVPAIGRLIRYSIYARPRLMQSVPAGAGPLTSPVSRLVFNAVFGFSLATLGIILLRRSR